MGFNWSYILLLYFFLHPSHTLPSIPSPLTHPPFSLPLPHSLSPHRDPLAQFEVEKREHEVKMHKMEQEMEEVFEMKVQEKLQKLKDIEADVSWRERQRIGSNGERE